MECYQKFVKLIRSTYYNTKASIDFNCAISAPIPVENDFKKVDTIASINQQIITYLTFVFLVALKNNLNCILLHRLGL